MTSVLLATSFQGAMVLYFHLKSSLSDASKMGSDHWIGFRSHHEKNRDIV